MPYQFVFRPNTTVTMSDGYGHTNATLRCQIFKPLLGVSLNGPQGLLPGGRAPNQAGAIIRGLVEIPSTSLLTPKPGPGYWSGGVVPTIKLNEDPNGETWVVTDAVPWLQSDGSHIWSFFAVKNNSISPPPPPPPPPPPGTTIILGSTIPTATLIALGVRYSATFPTLGAPGWCYVPVPTLTGYTITVNTIGGGPNGTATGGTHSPPTGSTEGTVSFGAPLVVPFFSHTGPELIITWNEPLGAPIDFTVTSP